MNRPCIKCGVLIPSGSRCAKCRPQQHYARGTKGRTATDWRWRKTSQRLRKQSPWCEECGTNQDLTVDHRIPLSHDESLTYEIANLRVLCRRHNAARGDRVTDEERQQVLDVIASRRRHPSSGR